MVPKIIEFPEEGIFEKSEHLIRECSELRRQCSELRRDFDAVVTSLDKVRKGTYATIGALRKEIDPVKHELTTLKESMVRCGA